ncbi:hypothetical protein CROQUDRAFT_670309 [Cronartium quercuum f. sp. fusiforme G11]|uniref:ferric-chelate reductase (NADPH) n=1 Tax=Cronartium quercuum f. sp. fusiforme G11 TaxID=708437 RepID=A0A9P6TEG3_9BASI|nr:hypothetical protein CROQUDRAFT_670309 [Cronartium quercuum f. sp. fusiforme G11]
MASPPPRAPAGPMADLKLDHDLAFFFAYVVLAGFGLTVLFRLPSFLQHARKQGKYGYILSRPKKIHTSPTPAPPLPATNTGALLRNSAIRRGWWFVRKTLMIRIPLTSGLSVGKILVMMIYIALGITLSLYKNSGNAVSLSNFQRFGFLAIAQLPITFGLSMKNSPLGYLIGEGYEKLNFLHRFTGRLMFLFGLIHFALLMRIQVKNTGTIHIGHAPHYYGFSALVSMLVMGLMGFRMVRHWCYQLFLATHVLGYIVVLVTLWKHSLANHRYVYAAIACVGVDHILKAIKTRYSEATMSAMPGGLTRIEVHGVNDGWRAGQHVFLRVLNGRNVLEKHPFTIANAPRHSSLHTSDQALVLVAKAAGDFTRRIHHIAGSSSETLLEKRKDSDMSSLPQAQVRVLVEGPYGAFFYNFVEYETVVLCAGGSGFSYCMGVLEEIVGKGLRGEQIFTQNIEVIWVLRDSHYAEGYESAIGEVIREAAAHLKISIHLRLYLTTNTQESKTPMKSVSFDFKQGTRPDFKSLIGHTAKNSTSLAVGVCGPICLVDCVQAAVRGVDVGGLTKIAVHS